MPDTGLEERYKRSMSPGQKHQVPGKWKTPGQEGNIPFLSWRLSALAVEIQVSTCFLRRFENNY